ncbi:MAG TPA: C4-type zinc ribbon domain-containing protein [Mycobacterium sp.]|nr:C4-type zinc ribbon domain-containing protein [Mycobacterium sp.]
MKAEATQQRSVLELAGVDAELRRIAHRSANLAEAQRVEALQADRRAAEDRAAVLGIAIEDLDGQVSRFEAEIESVRQREDRDRVLLDSPSTGAKQLSELQHELETLERRQASLEDSLLELMEQREGRQAEQHQEHAAISALDNELGFAGQALDSAMAEIDSARTAQTEKGEALRASLDPELVTLYERAGAGALQGGRCGACRIEIDRGELSRIAAAAADDVLRCPECGAILVRTKA